MNTIWGDIAPMLGNGSDITTMKPFTKCILENWGVGGTEEM